MIQTWVERFIYWEHKDWWELQQEQDLVFQVMRREGDEQKMKQCQLLNGQHDMIVNSVSTLVVLDPVVVFDSWWMNWKGGGWRRHCGQWRMGPASSLLGKNSQKNPLFSFVFRNWKGVSTSSVRRWSWTPTSTSSQLALPMSTMWGGKVDTWQNCQHRSSSAFMLSFEYTSTLLPCYSSLFSVKASWISWALSTNSWWASLFLNST